MNASYPAFVAIGSRFEGNHAAVVHAAAAVAFEDSARIFEPSDRKRMAEYHSRMAEHAVKRHGREECFANGYADQQIDLSVLDRDWSAPKGPKFLPDDVWLLVAIATDASTNTQFARRLEAHVELVTNGIHIDRFYGSARGTHVITTKRLGDFLVNLDLIDYDDEAVADRLKAAYGLRLGYAHRVWSGEVKVEAA